MTCPLCAPNADSRQGRCDWCGTDLPRMKSGHVHPTRRWCTPACSDAYWSNHMWPMASAAARNRDGHQCVRCGAKPAPWTAPYAERIATTLEVNHKDPRKGAGYLNGCHHHLDGLETLCHACHVAETTRQLREWKYTDPPKPKGRDRPSEAPSLPLWEFAS